MKKKCLSMLLAGFLVFGASAGPASAATKTKTASKLSTYYSWAGIKIFTNGVKANYITDGKKITTWGKPLYNGSTSIAWTSCNEKAGWSIKGTTSGKAYGQAKFVLGIATDKFSIGLQSVHKTDYANATK